MFIKIIQHKEEWDTLVSSCENFDFYHTYDYHKLSKKRDETPMLFSYTEEDKIICIPLLIRKIAKTPYLDATSVYGYPGPISRNINANFDNSNFKTAFNKILSDNKIITIFSRLNPYIPFQENILDTIGGVDTSGKIVNIDIKQNLESQRAGYNKRYKTYINKSLRLCYVKKAESKSDILEFIEIYHQNMRRVNAKNSYFFTEDYFFNLVNSNSFKTEILIAICNNTNKIIAGAMFIKQKGIVQYHLSGTKTEYLHFNAIKLLIDEMRIKSTKEGYKYFNLGGGLNNKDDSLLHFKSGFSKNFRNFKLWKYVINPEIYKELILQKETKSCRTNYMECTHYFPCYRCDL
ncbi:peptidoglycan bridge formation glycyltransferase FemA/FemB family protein [uncultured Maribacter sp.]|uniref:peptidoglycan bridge formation glycyltransferase FemA/FemB family protein n=1 Tax=uncultured Maribacter sp. TaxID=431308 RepID=UPI0026342DC9|nr:peptidoglycan bridge formation glycyltransferase FemA/FemB family protein [uncultured Maribacter sp.]